MTILNQEAEHPLPNIMYKISSFKWRLRGSITNSDHASRLGHNETCFMTKGPSYPNAESSYKNQEFTHGILRSILYLCMN